jgi:hypothetical protein
MAKANEGRLYPDADGPQGFASRLAGYIKDAPYIRAMAIREFGEHRAPSIETIRAMQAEHARQREVFAKQGFVEEEAANDDKDWQPDTFVPKERVRRYEGSGTVYKPVAVEVAPSFKVIPIRCHTDVIAAVANAFDLTHADLVGPSRKTKHVAARAVAARIFLDRGNSTLAVGRFLRRDHSSILNLIHSFDDRCKRFPQMRLVYERLSATQEAEAA